MQATFFSQTKILHMKFFLITILTTFSWFQALKSQTTLVAGDIAIIGYNADNVPDNFSFIPLVNLAAGTVINFTDFGWTSESNGFQLSCNVANTTGAVADGAITWTSPAGGVLLGTQVTVVCGGASPSASLGTVVGLQGTANSIDMPPIEYMSLSPGGDHIFAFQGTLASPTLITAIGMNGPWDISLTNCEFTSSKSLLPPALGGTNSMAITTEVDNAIYNCSVTTGTASVLRTAILNQANWNVDNNTPFTLPIACFNPPLPITWLTQPKLVLNNKSIDIHWSVTNQINNDKFIIEHSGDGRFFSPIGEVDGDGTNNEDRHYEHTHNTPTIETNYYRIKQIDFDGQYSYSIIASMVFDGDHGDIAIYPNPSTDQVTVSVPEDMEVSVVDMMGRVLKKESLSKEKNRIDVSDLPTGIYIFTIGTNKNRKFIKE